MTVEKIINRIKRDASETVKQIIKEAEEKAKGIIEEAKEEARGEAKKIIEDGRKQAENIRRIHVSRANQDAQRRIMNIKEEFIERCFARAVEKLQNLSGDEYKKIVATLIEKARRTLDGDIIAYISRDEDEEILKNYDIPVKGRIEAIGGVILQSKDGSKRIDNTFEGVLSRRKPVIRTIIGKILFTGVE
ncbi:MAG: hypothetical protein DRN12_00420 [Thermoplasmata archaeon]|nr:MAG: hypothetical protein DRN12_00420 [Thermoplasmata archaeon]